MNEFYSFLTDFAANHYFLMFCLMWLLCFVCMQVVSLAFKLANRVLRSLNILFRGWPPEHLDADGDFDDDEKLDKFNP